MPESFPTTITSFSAVADKRILPGEKKKLPPCHRMAGILAWNRARGGALNWLSIIIHLGTAIRHRSCPFSLLIGQPAHSHYIKPKALLFDKYEPWSLFFLVGPPVASLPKRFFRCPFHGLARVTLSTLTASTFQNRLKLNQCQEF